MTAASRDDLVARLAAVVGAERASELVESAARALDVQTWDASALDLVIDHLAAARGAIGATVRLHRSRLRMLAGRAAVEAASPPPASPPPAARALDSNRQRLVGLLSPSLGVEKSEALIDAAAKRRGLRRSPLSRADALLILEELTQEGGLVGTVARFAKARAHLEFDK
jgi:hypothetical protein